MARHPLLTYLQYLNRRRVRPGIRPRWFPFAAATAWLCWHDRSHPVSDCPFPHGMCTPWHERTRKSSVFLGICRSWLPVHSQSLTGIIAVCTVKGSHRCTPVFCVVCAGIAEATADDAEIASAWWGYVRH